MVALIDPARRKKVNTQFGKSYQKLIVKIKTTNPICVENFNEFPSLGRFTLRDEGKTIGLGKVMEQISRRVEPVEEEKQEEGKQEEEKQEEESET